MELLRYTDSSLVSALWRTTFPSGFLCRYSLSAHREDERKREKLRGKPEEAHPAIQRSLARSVPEIQYRL